ncbi:MAG: glycoside hydrolase family 92 protein [Anaerolineae bacterium]|nr:glycoside hydrolase family 92 protein [Anaerolineae bacterium]
MKNLLPYMDPFFGNGTIDLPKPKGIAATWFFIKAQTGNTYPGACAPFGMISVCPYSGAYPTGYGKNAPNTHATPAQRFDEFVASGFTHLQQSGTGAIETYYNYVRVTPLVGDLEQLGTRWTLENETANPGYYAASLAGTGIKAELTASPRAAFHRYTFTQTPAEDAGHTIAIDFSNGGIDFPDRRTIPTKAEIVILADNAAQGRIVMAGLPIYVYVETDLPDGTCVMWAGKQEITGQRSLLIQDVSETDYSPFGVLFKAGRATIVQVRVGFSLRSTEQARRNAHGLLDKSFDQVVQETQQLWNAHAHRVQVDGGSKVQKTIFYSSLYHSLVKPADWYGESPFWQDEVFYVDFATMWDQYKTQLPLLLTLYPERGRDAVNTLISLAEHTGGFPNGLVLNANLAQFDNQARSLAHYTIADAYHRHLEGIDWQRALEAMVADLRQANNADFFQRGLVYPVTHTLDLAGACFCTAQLAKALGQDDLYREIMPFASYWKNAYDQESGKLIEARYYEGGLWNYSFRLLHDMAGRIALYAKEADFIADLDRFFGYGQPPIVQPTVPGDRETMRRGHALNRFEGYNNEPDIETPYGYIYAGRHDRTAEVVRAGMQYMFTTGRGGLPGNNDSGGLTSCYVWNAIGLFPVTGQPIMLIGSPIFDSVLLDFGNESQFSVRAINNSDANIYVQSATLNGQPIDHAYITIDELRGGGVLELVMGDTPSNWARDHRPPSCPAE